MIDVMKGVRVLEIAEHTFVPSASAVLADWGADVVKVEHAERGDAMRGLARTGVMNLSQQVHVLNEHSNRGKRSIGVDISKPDGLEVIYKLAATSDVFLTNKLPRVLANLKIDVADIRARNPKIIYVRGTSFGPKGADRDRGGYDMTAFWCRAGSASGATAAEVKGIAPQPGPAYGDSMGGAIIAGGIAAALFKRERTGEPSIVDVSLLGVGAWAMAAAVALSLQMKMPWGPIPMGGHGPGNPLVGVYQTADGRYISLVMLQGFAYWRDFCEHIGRPELAGDSRFDSHEKLMGNGEEARAAIREAFAGATLAEWTQRLATMKGQWAPVQNTLELAADPQVVANGYLARASTKHGIEFDLVASPVQFDEKPTGTARGPEFNEHGDEILQELGYDWDAIVAMKAAGAVT